MSDIDVDAVVEHLRNEPRESGQNAGLRYRGKRSVQDAEMLTEQAKEAAFLERSAIEEAAAEQLQELNADIEGSVEAAREQAGVREEAHLDLADAESFLTQAVMAKAHSAGLVADANAPRLSIQQQSDAAFMAAYNNNESPEPPTEYTPSGAPTPAEEEAMDQFLAEDEEVGLDALSRTIYRDATTGEEYVLTE